MSFEDELKQFLLDLKKIKKSLNQVKTKGDAVNSTSLRSEIERVAKYWFSKVKKELIDNYSYASDGEVLKKRSDVFTHLIQLASTHGNKKGSYLKDLQAVTLNFQRDIIGPIQINAAPKDSNLPLNGAFDELLQSIKNADQNAYLNEAISCAKSGYLKASVVLGWCACIDHIHKKIDSLGYPTFNVVSAQLASQQKGRFKNFNAVYNISSISELREVFDKNILTIIEGMGLVDFNQGTRLKSCFDMRNHSGHPGDAPITPYNVMSFFSDISEIVLTNKKFEVNNP